MDPVVRKLIDQPWPHRQRYVEIGALLPADDAELDRWFKFLSFLLFSCLTAIGYATRWRPVRFPEPALPFACDV